jgi:ABC-type branched-subunit amino acid transport system ATPase component/ABC-type branched-subunit amino acid transport system permease subunit
VLLSLFLFLRYRHVKQNGGKAESHFWQKPAVMRTVTYAIFGIGGIAAIGTYLATIFSVYKNNINQEITGIPWIVFGLVLTLTLVLGYLSYTVYKNAANYTGAHRPSFWDKPGWVGKMLFSSLLVGGSFTLLVLLVYLFSFRILQNFWFALFLGALVAGLFGYLLALPSLRVKGPYLSMITIAFGLIVVELGYSDILKPFIGSQGGMTGIPYPISARDETRDIIVQPNTPEAATNQLFITTAIIALFAVFTLYIIRNFMRTRWGRSFIALRENEIGAASVGINVTRMKTLAFVFSAVLTGIAGVLNSYSFSFIGPNFAVLSQSVAYVTMLILGGAGTLLGPVLGAIMITIIPQVLRRLENAKPAEDIFTLVGSIAPWLLLALVALYFFVRNRDTEGNRLFSRYILAIATLGYGGLFIYQLATGFDEPARFWSFVSAALGPIVVISLFFWGWNYTKRHSAAETIGTTLGLAVVFNSLEIFQVILKTLGSSNGVGISKRSLDATTLGLIALYLALIIAALVFASSEGRKIAVRGLAAGLIFSVPLLYRVVIGLIQNSNAAQFKPQVVELTMYGAILLYFLFLVPKGVGGLLGEFIDRYFPTKRTINWTAASEESPAADGQTTKKRQLAFHRTISEHAEVLKLNKVSRDFKGLRAVDSVDIRLERGEIHALIGPNGAGKTTVLNLITGIYPLTKGEINFKGERLDGLKPHHIAQQGISRTFQNLQVFGDMTALENVMVGFHLHTKQAFWPSLLGLPGVRREEERTKALAMELLKFVGLADRAYSKAKDLPYGYQRYLEIARALAVEPEVILLDEPAAGLNPQEITDMDRLIRKICNEGVTVILIEHHMDLVMEISDHITVLDYGKKISEGTPVLVQRDQKVKDAYFGPEVMLDARG